MKTNKSIRTWVATIALGLFFNLTANAAISPVGIGLFPPVQFPPEDVGITGLRINLLWGKHRSVYGVDIGVIGNSTTQTFSGVLQAAGIFNHNKAESHVLGLQVAGITNINVNKSTVYGAQLALGMNFNSAESTVVGLQVAALGNNAPFTKVVGVQVGLYNKARSVYGFQIGLINVTENLHGLQIGLINFNKTGLFAVCPALNFGF